MVIVRHIVLGFIFGIILMFITELGFASVNSLVIQEDTLQAQEHIEIE